jgi:hypothetical protein
MTKIELEIHDDVVSTLNKIKNINDPGIELEIPEGSIIFDSIVNLKLLKKEAERFQKTLHFHTHDPDGINLLHNLEGEDNVEAINNLSDELPEENKTKFFATSSSAKPKFNFKLNFNMPKINLKPNLKLTGIFVVLAILISASIFVYFISKLPKANVSLVVNSEPLARSIQIKVKNGASTSADSKIVRGLVLSETSTVKRTTPATGTKQTGSKSTGKAKIFNKTTEAKVFKKGQHLTYEKDNKELEFVLEQEITVPARTESAEVPPIITPGEIAIC